MAHAQAGRCLSAVFGAVVLAGLSGTAHGQDSCQLLVFQPGQTDGEVSDTAPVQGSVCYALGVAPGQEVDVTLTYGGEARFSIAGLVQDQRSFAFRAERSLYEIRVHQGNGATDVEPFVLAIHAEPLPLPEPPEASSPPASESEETAESASEIAPTQTAAVPDTVVETISPQPGPGQQVATQDTIAPEPADPAPVDRTPPPPEERVYGPGWSIEVSDDGSAARVEGAATDYVSRFAARCDDTSVQGVHITLSGDPGFILSRTEGSDNAVRLAITGNDGTVQTYEAALAYQPSSAVWESRDPLPTAFLEAFSDGALMTIRSASNRPLATFTLYGVEEVRAALEPLCLAGPSIAPNPTPASVSAQTQTSPSPAVAEPTEDEPDPQQSFAPGWAMTQQGGVVTATGGAEDSRSQFVGRCAGEGLDVILRGDPSRVLSRSEGAVDPIRIEIRIEDQEPRSFNAVLLYDATDRLWRTQGSLPAAFREAFAYGILMDVSSAAGAPIASFRLRGTLQMVLQMDAVCRAGVVAATEAPVREPATITSAPSDQVPESPGPRPEESVLAAVESAPVPTGLTQVPPIEERTYGAGWTVTEGASDIAVVGTATDYLTLFQAYCDISLPAGIHLTISGPSMPDLSRTETAATPIRVEVTANDGSVQSFTTALAYRAAQDSWRSGLPLSTGFVDVFTRGAIMKVVTDGGATVATFVLAGLEQAREPMTKICTFGSALDQSAAATVSAAPPPVTPTQPATAVAPATPVATTGAEAPDGWVVSTEGNEVVARGLAVDGVSVLQARCGTGLPPGVHLALNGDPHGRLQRGGTQPVRIEITDDDQAPEVFNTVLGYQDTARYWVSQLPLPSSFAYAFGHGVIMKIFTADNVPAATFILFGTAEARDRMRAVCGF